MPRVLTRAIRRVTLSIYNSRFAICADTSGFPYGGHALNWGLELPAIRSRLLMGFGMWKGDSDAFLYFRLNKWSQYLLCMYVRTYV